MHIYKLHEMIYDVKDLQILFCLSNIIVREECS